MPEKLAAGVAKGRCCHAILGHIRVAEVRSDLRASLSASAGRNGRKRAQRTQKRFLCAVTGDCTAQTYFLRYSELVFVAFAPTRSALELQFAGARSRCNSRAQCGSRRDIHRAATQCGHLSQPQRPIVSSQAPTLSKSGTGGGDSVFRRTIGSLKNRPAIGCKPLRRYSDQSPLYF